MKQTAHKLFTDGGARGNPGPSGIGGVLTDFDGKVIAAYSKYIGVATNNQAEYRSLLAGLELALNSNIRRLSCYLDSQLLVEQMNFRYKVKDRFLADLFAKANDLRRKFDYITFTHIPREQNTLADKEVNKALDATEQTG